MVADDFDGVGNLDVLINGNDYGTAVLIGRFDALNGLLLKGDETGGFLPLSIMQSGIYIPGNGKALVKLLSAKGDYLIAASQHQGPVKMFQLKHKINAIPVQPSDTYAIIQYKNGATEKRGLYYGTSFLSQSARFIALNEYVSNVSIFYNKGKKRMLLFDKNPQ